jgi:hypothetical protein
MYVRDIFIAWQNYHAQSEHIVLIHNPEKWKLLHVLPFVAYEYSDK